MSALWCTALGPLSYPHCDLPKCPLFAQSVLRPGNTATRVFGTLRELLNQL